MEIEIDKGIGYVSIEQRRKDKLPIGVIAIDAIFSPVKSVNFSVQDMRVGERIDYNKVVMEIETDGSVQPEQALKDATNILIDHFKVVAEVAVPELKEAKKSAKKKEVKEIKTKKVKKNETRN